MVKFLYIKPGVNLLLGKSVLKPTNIDRRSDDSETAFSTTMAIG